jgi:hypothetical protein
MSAEPVSELTRRRTDGDVLARLNAIDHRLHQISTQLAPHACLLSDGEDGRATKSRRRLLSLRPAGSDA